MPPIELFDVYDIEVPEFQTMYVGDDDKPQDFDRTKALSVLGPRVRLLVDINSTHSGTLVNGRVYPGFELRRAIPTWTRPYKRALVDRHPGRSGLLSGTPEEPKVLGRVESARFRALTDSATMKNDWINPPPRAAGSGFVVNKVLVTDKDAVDRIVDGRMLTVSVGMKSDSMICPICLADWSPSMQQSGEPPETCEHRPGNTYKVDGEHFNGKLPFYFVTRKMTYDHIAETFRPAQPYASVQGFELAEDSAFGEMFIGQPLSGQMGMLALCDEQGHVVRLAAPEGAPAPIPTNEEAMIMASLKEAGTLDMEDGYSDGYNAAAIQAAIDRVASSGDFGQFRKGLGSDFGHLGAYAAKGDKFADACWKLFDRYTGPDREPVSLKLWAAVTTERTDEHQAEDKQKQDNGGKPMGDMSWDQIEALSEEILDKIKDLGEDECLTDVVLKEKLDSELWEKVDFTSLTDEDREVIENEEKDRELQGVRELLIDAVLTTAARKKLPESAFCGPNRSFPAHDKAHVRNALARLPQATRFSSEQKSSIRACLLRRAKSMGIKTSPGKDSASDGEDMKALIEKVKSLEKSLADSEAKVTLLTGELKATRDECAVLSAKVHDTLASRVLDLRRRLSKPDVVGIKTKEDEAKWLEDFANRTTESLGDSVRDLTAELAVADVAPEPPVQGSDSQSGDMDAQAIEDASKKKEEKKLTNRERIRLRLSPKKGDN